MLISPGEMLDDSRVSSMNSELIPGHNLQALRHGRQRQRLAGRLKENKRIGGARGGHGGVTVPRGA